MQIHILDSETIDKIAAGEVVERPASVVKELVENAIDAGATAVTVEAKNGGIDLIRVTDNGSGIRKEQIRTAFLRHATSKIENADDLTRISSLGFRGEALSSIAAVSKVEVITKCREYLTGTRILLEGAVEKSFEEIGAPDGTTFIMKNLFYNTPVRRKFLKQPATEGGYIVDLMEHLALSRPDISFKLIVNNQTKFHTSGNGDLREVIYRIYGREVAASLVPVQVEQDGIRIEGYLGKPILVRSNRNFEIYYINGRFIKSNVIAKAIEEGYKEYLMQHKFPFCVLHITMNAEGVDVNVHPTKMDVRFSDTIGFCNLLTGIVRNTLKTREMIPEAVLGDEKEERKAEKEQAQAAQKVATPELFEQRRTEQYRVMEAAKYEAEKPKMQDYMKNPVWSRVLGDRKLPVKAEDEIKASEIKASEYKEPESKTIWENTVTPKDVTENAVRKNDVAENKVTENTIIENTIIDNTDPDEEEAFFVEAEDYDIEVKSNVESNIESNIESGFNIKVDINAGLGIKEEKLATQASPTEETIVADVSQINLFEEKLLSVENRSRYRIIGQVFDTYWLVQFEDKLFIIDQHAAHEKVKYERLMKQYREKDIVSQTLMPPIIVSLSGQEQSIYHEYAEVFEKLGFEVEAFGGNEYALRRVPVDLYGCSEKEMFLEVLDELAEGSGRGSLKVVEEKIASMSCKAAVKGNNRLSAAEAEMLIDELLTLDNPYNCPHGRPTIISMDKQEMEKKFKRIV